jgi:hypothetical protein
LVVVVLLVQRMAPDHKVQIPYLALLLPLVVVLVLLPVVQVEGAEVLEVVAQMLALLGPEIPQSHLRLKEVMVALEPLTEPVVAVALPQQVQLHLEIMAVMEVLEPHHQ